MSLKKLFSKRNIKAFVIFTSLCLMFFVSSLSAEAISQTPRGRIIDLDTIEDLVSDLLYTLVTISGFLAVGYIVYGGITYMAAGGDSAKATKATERIKNGIIGAAVVFATGTILVTIQYIVSGCRSDFFDRIFC